MNNAERKKRISDINDQITALTKKRISTVIRLMNTDAENEGKSLSNLLIEIDNSNAKLIQERTDLQVDYLVQYFDSKGILQTSRLTLNIDVDINTKQNGIDAYLNNTEVGEVIRSVVELLENLEIQHISKIE